MISNKAYDILKWVALIALDALGVCYKTLAAIWGWPFGDEVLATCTAISLCIGALLGISTAQYNRALAVDNGAELKKLEAERNQMEEELALLDSDEFDGEGER